MYLYLHITSPEIFDFFITVVSYNGAYEVHSLKYVYS